MIHVRDKKFPQAFDTVFKSVGIQVHLTLSKTPNANAFAERWIRSVREECLDHLLIWNEGHLRRVLAEYVHYFNERRPHQDTPESLKLVSSEGAIHRRDVLGGIIHDYYREAA